MGYETRLYVVSEYAEPDLDGPVVCSTLATINLAKAGYDTATGRLLSASRKAAERYYAVYTDAPTDAPVGALDQSNGLLTEDPYGERLSAVPVRALLDALREDNQAEPYRRFTWAIAMIESIFGDPGAASDERFRILQWGY